MIMLIYLFEEYYVRLLLSYKEGSDVYEKIKIYFRQFNYHNRPFTYFKSDYYYF